MQAAINMAQELNKELLGSEEYRRYRETNQRLKEDAELYGRYNEFADGIVRCRPVKVTVICMMKSLIW